MVKIQRKENPRKSISDLQRFPLTKVWKMNLFWDTMLSAHNAMIVILTNCDIQKKKNERRIYSH